MTKETIPPQFSKMCHEMVVFTQSLQKRLCQGLEELDADKSVKFLQDSWERDGGGGGLTCVLESGDTFEKAGVNTSQVFGEITDKEAPMFRQLVKQQNSDITDIEGATFFATGISVVIHPRNPFVPTTHMNYRYFELQSKEKTLWWFGGGADLTPYYLFKEDACHFHQALKQACDKHDLNYYPKFKSRCDEYFYLPHRNETRGVGGIFFDYLNNLDKESHFSFIKDAGEAFLLAYLPIVDKRKQTPYLDMHKAWQRVRRGRYVEFNLLYDRGTLFGLKTRGRIESIFMSLPSDVSWVYDESEKVGKEEGLLLSVVKNPREWV